MRLRLDERDVEIRHGALQRHRDCRAARPPPMMATRPRAAARKLPPDLRTHQAIAQRDPG